MDEKTTEHAASVLKEIKAEVNEAVIMDVFEYVEKNKEGSDS